MFVDIYAIQTVPPSNINRDDTGSPKTAVYGGVRRARVSSQAWKRAMREGFGEYLPEGSLGVRTKLAAELLASRISEKREDLGDRALELAAAVLGVLGLKVEKSKRDGGDEGKSSTSYLVFIAQHELTKLADIAINWADEGKNLKKLDKDAKAEAKKAFNGVQAVDIALIGRMLADVPELNTDASSQVAHAISVDKVAQEFDYFTAIDDCASDDNAGAAMIGTIDFSSSTLYRYANVNVDALFAQLKDVEATSHGAGEFVEAFIRSMPTGKQNTFANRSLPSYVLIALRDKQPINAVSAFEVPVHAGESESVSRRAAKKLGERLLSIEGAYDLGTVAAWYVSEDGMVDELETIAKRVSLSEMIENIQNAVAESCRGGE